MKSLINKLSEYISDIDFNGSPKMQESKLKAIKLIKGLENSSLDRLLKNEQKDKIKRNLENILNEFENFQSNEDEMIGQRINYFIYESYGVLLKEIENFEEIYVEKIKNLNSKFKSLDEALRKIENDHHGLEAELKNAVNSSKESSIKIDELIGTAVIRTNTMANEVRNEQQERLNSKIRDIDLMFKQQKAAWETRLKGLESKGNKFETIYEKATTYFSESRFDDYAASERKYADTYRKHSVTLMILVVIFIGIITIYNSIIDQNAEWYDYITRSFLVFTLMIPAIYTSRESTRHRRNSDRYTQMANELKAFEITLEVDDLDLTVKNRVKEEIYKRYFGNIFIDSNESTDIGNTMTSFIPQLLRGSETSIQRKGV